MYETFEHTADLGLRVRASDLNVLFAEAGQALFSTILDDNLDSVVATSSLEVNLPAEELDYLLFDWLKTLLYHFEAEHWVAARFDVAVGPDGLKATCWGEPLDRERHSLGHEVKAITYHGLLVERTADGWLAEVIVDI